MPNLTALFQMLLQKEEADEDPLVFVVVLDQNENVREMRFQPITDCAALMKLHDQTCSNSK